MYLPGHILAEEIFRLLDTPTLSAARGVCRDWRAAGGEELRRRGWRSQRSWAATRGMLCAYCRRDRAAVRNRVGVHECVECQDLIDPACADGARLVNRTEATTELIWPFDPAECRHSKARRIDTESWHAARVQLWRVRQVARCCRPFTRVPVP